MRSSSHATLKLAAPFANAAEHPLADFTRDGNWDFFDISGFLNTYSIVQCPNFGRPSPERA